MKLRLVLCLIVGILCLTSYAQVENAVIGSIIDVNGVKALVFKVDEEGHGTAISVKALRGQRRAWGSNHKLFSAVDMSDKNDGRANTYALIKYVNEHKMDLSEFPIFEWCNSLGNGWYIPSSGQIEEFVNFYLGNNQDYSWDDDSDIELIKLSPSQINELFMDNGGHPFLSNSSQGLVIMSGVYTSTKTSNNKVVIYQYDFKGNSWRLTEYSPDRLNQGTMGRAFYDF